MHRQADPPEAPLAEKLAFLRRPEAFAEGTSHVDVRETHMSWVFLTDTHAYKLKKPVRHPFLDYSTLDRRRLMCAEEIRLNRRLADWVYLGLVALVRDKRNDLALQEMHPASSADAVDWLVKSVRLPAGLLLDEAIRHDAVSEPGALRTAAHLAAFYRRADPVALAPSAFIERFARAINENAGSLAAAGIPNRRFSAAVRALLAFLDERSALLAGRMTRKHIIEGHGDLRPEHVFLGEPPAVIDCLEFSRDFRLIDPLEELAFLQMECERLDAARWGELFLGVYLRETGDDAAEELMRFYMSSRACLRAKLALGHLGESDVREPKKWRDQADRYLELANRHAAWL
jgi:aminoglycoside phosphotransferase family enzyme